MSGRDTTVLLKLVVDGASGRVVGCHVVGEGAAEMIQLAAVAVNMGATKADFDATMALHPTVAEELVTMRQKSASYAREARNSGFGWLNAVRQRPGCRRRVSPCHNQRPHYITT